ncbi:glycosyltransferase family 4 protein [Nocardia seriolae]
MAQPVRVSVFLTHSASPSGAGLATLRLVSAMPAGRVAVMFTEDGPMLRLMAERGIENRLVRGSSGPLRLGWELGAAARELDATVLVAVSTEALLLGAVAARRARVPLVWHVHQRISAEYFGRRRALMIRLLGGMVARGVIANSRNSLAALYTWRRQAVVAYPGVEFTGLRHAEEPREQRPADETVIAVVGRLAPWKGQDLFLRALADVKTLPREVFLVGGARPEERAYLAELEVHATALGLPVTFTGHVEDPEPYLRHADILVHCSVLPEPFGQVVVEGMMAGCAVIATRPGGPEEIIESGVNGLLVRAGDRAELTHALDTLITDQELRTKLADAGRVRARDFDVAESARIVTAFLTGLRRPRAFRSRIADIVSRNSRRPTID